MNYVLVDDEERALNLLRIMLTRFDGFSKENDHIYTFTQPVVGTGFYPQDTCGRCISLNDPK